MPDHKHFTQWRHGRYEARHHKWQTAKRHYEADLDTLRKEELIQREQGESDEQFKERKKRSDYLPLFATMVDSVVGREMAQEPEVERRWQSEDTDEGLGDPDDSSTPAGKLKENADGDGANYRTVVQRAATELVKTHEPWTLVDGIRRDEKGRAIGEASVHVFEPQSIVNWRTEGGRMVEVLYQYESDTRGSIRDKPGTETRYKLYDLEGWQDFVKNEDEEWAAAGEKNEYGTTYYATPDQNIAVLPIFRTRVPLKRFVGYMWAEKNKMIFNRQSLRDNLIDVANRPMINLVATREQWLEEIKPTLDKGSNVLLSHPEASGTHDYIAPDTAPAQLATEVLEQLVQFFYISAFRSYENAVRAGNRTATEVEHESQMGEETFLSTLATALDEWERQVGFLLEQTYFPDQPGVWGQFTVKRPRDFSPLDEQAVASKMKEAFFPGGAVPIGDQGRAQVARMIADSYGVETDEQGVEANVRRGSRAEELRLDRLEASVAAENGDEGIESRRRAIEEGAQENGED